MTADITKLPLKAKPQSLPVKPGTRHFLDIADFDTATLTAMLTDARARKAMRKGLPKGALDPDRPLDGHALALIFDKHSTRTRISFDIAMRQLGGTTLMMSGKDM